MLRFGGSCKQENRIFAWFRYYTENMIARYYCSIFSCDHFRRTLIYQNIFNWPFRGRQFNKFHRRNTNWSTVKATTSFQISFCFSSNFIPLILCQSHNCAMKRKLSFVLFSRALYLSNLFLGCLTMPGTSIKTLHYFVRYQNDKSLSVSDYRKLG